MVVVVVLLLLLLLLCDGGGGGAAAAAAAATRHVAAYVAWIDHQRGRFLIDQTIVTYAVVWVIHPAGRYAGKVNEVHAPAFSFSITTAGAIAALVGCASMFECTVQDARVVVAPAAPALYTTNTPPSKASAPWSLPSPCR
jgi:hypothetical protein